MAHRTQENHFHPGRLSLTLRHFQRNQQKRKHFQGRL